MGTQYTAPTDASYYLGQLGLQGLTPQAFNANTLSSMFSPQGMQFTPANNMATNPFLSLFMDQAGKETKLQRRQVPGMDDGAGGMGSGGGL